MAAAGISEAAIAELEPFLRQPTSRGLPREEWVRSIRRPPPLPFSYRAFMGGNWTSDPFSDHRVTQLAASLPRECWVHGGLTRSVARRAAVGVLPDEVRLRRGRGRQGVDNVALRLRHRADFIDAIGLVADSARASTVVDTELLGRSVDSWPQADQRAHQQWENWHGRALGLGLYLAWLDNVELTQCDEWNRRTT